MSRFSQVNKTSLLFHIIATALFVLAFALALTAAGLFGSANARDKKNAENNAGTSYYCRLFVKLKGNIYYGKLEHASTSTCNYAIAGELVAAIGLLAMIILSIVKMATCTIKLVIITIILNA